MLGKIIGQLLKEAREKVGLTQKEVAKVCGKTKGAISQLERGRVKDPSLNLILSYLKALGIPKGEFFSQLDELEIKEILPEEIDKEDYPKEAKKKVIRQAIGITYQKKGVISFPEYAKMRVEGLLFRMEPKERERYLSFAYEYFNCLKEGASLEPISEKYKKLHLDFSLMRKIKKIIIKAYKRELKRAERKIILDEKKRKMLKGIAQYQECQERIRERVKKLLFTKKGVTFTHFHVYTLIAKWFFGFLKKLLKKKGEIPFTFKKGEVSFHELGFPEVDEWREGIIEKEKVNREILGEVMKIVIEEYYKIYLSSEANEKR